MTRRLMSIAAVGLLASLAACAGSAPAATPKAETTPTAAVTATATATPTAEATPTAPAETQPGFTIESELPFATFDGVTLTLDLWLPADAAGAPIVLHPYYADDVARAGAIVVDIQQGVGDPPDNDDEGVRFLSDHGAWVRARAEAAACAIHFARARAAELGSNDPVVVLGGHSEGGGAAAHVALFGATLEERWDEFAASVGGPSRQVECLVADGSTHVDALIGSAGTYDLYVPAIEGLYGRTYQQSFDPDLQAFLASAVGANPELTVRLFHGTFDQAIPATVSEDFAAMLANAGYDVQYTTFDGRHTAPPTELGLPVFKELLGL